STGSHCSSGCSGCSSGAGSFPKFLAFVTASTFWTVIFSGAGEIGRIDIPQRGSLLCASTGVLSSETARVHHADWWLGCLAERGLPVILQKDALGESGKPVNSFGIRGR